MLVQASSRPTASAHIIVLGNEKGGTGKSTLAMHVAVALLHVNHQFTERGSGVFRLLRKLSPKDFAQSLIGNATTLMPAERPK